MLIEYNDRNGGVLIKNKNFLLAGRPNPKANISWLTESGFYQADILVGVKFNTKNKSMTKIPRLRSCNFPRILANT